MAVGAGFVPSRIGVLHPGLGKPRLEDKESHMGVGCRTRMAGELQMVSKSQSLRLADLLSVGADL
jgi:hypothetical protein